MCLAIFVWDAGSLLLQVLRLLGNESGLGENYSFLHVAQPFTVSPNFSVRDTYNHIIIQEMTSSMTTIAA